MTNERDPRIDFFRGLALIFIFWDHVPENPFAQLTLRNFGFSDAAEVFVFLAGYAAVLAYGRVAQRDGYTVACLRILRRTWVLYVAHIFLLTLLMGIVFVANNHVDTRDMVREMGLEYFVGNPQQALADELLLRFKPNLTDPLPLYILLMGALPLILPILLRNVAVAVALSIALYMMVPLFGWNLRAYEGGGYWYFNPVAWQLIFVFGGAFALYTQRPCVPLPQRRPVWRQPLFLAAALYLLAAGTLTFLWKFPAVHDALMPTALSDLIYPISKTDLSPLRLLHFVALVYVVARLLPASHAWLENWPARQTCRMGRYSLEIFCLGVLLAPLADGVNALANDAWQMRVITALLGLGLMLLLSNWLELNKRLGSPKAAQVARV
ncbi:MULTISPECIES: OpgC domain-containing protein [unclassified Pseudomonas]|uniref:OpgC domain-containing protein n=1 Tax=unclassified Pseudomonas TaxID=196821 RepID=UPI000D39AB9E|nr:MULTISPECIES: OpgC domain-containing protein [unclassified Pseudomonas]RAU43283.1 OpgC domain-containing protein [Pseudomonas sp. RIT 409]RAU50327.1 OpgC domain-containing protein [Pseudomonas sp. RIT 412]